MSSVNDVTWRPTIRIVALSARVLAVATTRIEGTWKAYCDAVPGLNHDHEWEAVIAQGAPLSERLARPMFPSFDDVKYSRD